MCIQGTKDALVGCSSCNLKVIDNFGVVETCLSGVEALTCTNDYYVREKKCVPCVPMNKTCP